MVFRDEQYAKILSPMEATEWGIEMETSDEQPAKVPF
jgi:hypothetical protein